ncbi:hypothetical protein [Corynebacterium argentoratense]|uniref:hypothetical protein n=1 Tax=Corynebacterium argentoratense TaxID=42817 RepID=UPI0036F3E22E
MSDPTTDEIDLGGGGWRQEFQGGAIYRSLQWSVATVTGLIRQRWDETGAKRGPSVAWAC